MEPGQDVSQPSVEEQALAYVDGLLRDEGEVDEEPKEQEAAPEEEAEAADTSDEEPAEEAEPEAEEAPEAEAESQPRKLKLKYRGEEKELEETEVIELAQKGFDYTQKTQELSRERESLNQKLEETLTPKMKELDEKLAMAEVVLYQTLAPEMQNTDWAKLAEEDPAEWARRKAKVESVQMNLQRVQAERQRLTQEAQQKQQAALKKQIKESRDTLQNDIPGWNDETYGRVLKAAVDQFGFSPEEVNVIVDPRAIKVLHEAMQYRALKAKPPEGKKVVTKAPKVLKPGAGEKPDQKADAWKEGMAKLRKSGGRKENALPLLEQILEREGIK